jgi:crotonobetainyl-CoA:carnitine CoA-transferase CaiB-like acyl-CoA transferase
MSERGTRPQLPPHQPRAAGAPKALEGIKVVDFSIIMAGPFCTQTLGDLGAEIIKIERPGVGDDIRNIPPFVDHDSGVSTFLISCNRNKKSFTLDLSKPGAREVALDLIADADIVVENFTSRVMKQYGLDYETLAEKFPRLIYLSVSGWGRTGSLAHAGGLDPVVSAECGVAALNGDPEFPPNVSTVPWVDLTTALNGTIAVLAALHARERLGRGQHIDMAMYDTGMSDMSYIGARYLGTGEGPERFGRFRPEAVPSGEYLCRDGKRIYIYTFNDKQFASAMKILGRPEIGEDPEYAKRLARYANSAKIIDLFGELVAQMDADDLSKQLADAGVPNGVMRMPSEAYTSAFAAERNMCVSIPHPVTGSVFNVGSPFQRMSLTPAVDPVAAPALGQHTLPILEGMGYDTARIEELVAAGIVSGQS